MRAQLENRRLVWAHWGAYEVLAESPQAPASGLRGLPEDPDPSPIGLGMLEALRSSVRVRRPAVRAGWLAAQRRGEHGTSGTGRGREAFVEVSWETALELTASELERVRRTHGNASIFGGSYGWASAGRFHHAQSQVHRFLNTIGGYVRHVDTYSLGAARVLMPHTVASMDELMAIHHSWEVLAEHTRLFVAFGGVPVKNAQISASGTARHRAREGLARMAERGCRFVNFSPVRKGLELDVPGSEELLEWIPIRPGTDTAVMLALACETIRAQRHDLAFLERYCTGFEPWRGYLLGHADGVVKDAAWAAAISGVPRQRIVDLAREMAAVRSFVNVSWSIQRADHGEQPYWAAVGLACVLGQVGLPGGGFGVGYGPVNLTGSPERRFAGPTLAQGSNAVSAFVPVARITEALESPGAPFSYNGGTHRYPDLRLVYWAGGNPFHHQQDINRLARAWQRPETIVVHEQVWTATAKMADIVLPATTAYEREDIGYSTREALIVAMKPVVPAPAEARDDYAIFSALARLLGSAAEYTEGLDTRQWLARLYNEAVPRAAAAGIELPGFEAFWEAGAVRLPPAESPVVMLGDFRADPEAAPLGTPSGRIELFSQRIADFRLADCLGHPAWFEPREWLQSARARLYPLHLISDQPHDKLHSQLDFAPLSRNSKINGREPVWIHPDDARARNIRDGDVVRVFNDRGACLAGAYVSDHIMPGVLKLSTGAWWDPLEPGIPGSLDKHGNPNVLTRDAGSSSLSQGSSAQNCLVEVERYDGELPPITAYDPPTFVGG